MMRRVALHEAAHTVMAQYVGVPIESVNIYPDEEEGVLGEVMLKDVPENLIGSVLIKLGGAGAEYLAGYLDGEDDTGLGPGDMEDATEFLLSCTESREEAQNLFNIAYDEVLDVLDRKWDEVIEIGRRLLEAVVLDGRLEPAREMMFHG